MTVRPDLAMVMVEVHAARGGRTLHNHAAHQLLVRDRRVAEWWMVEALPAESDAFWSSWRSAVVALSEHRLQLLGLDQLLVRVGVGQRVERDVTATGNAKPSISQGFRRLAAMTVRYRRRRRRELEIDSLSPQDASFLEIEDEVSHMHIGSVGVYEGPAPSREELLAAVEAKLHLVPRYRQKVRYPPLHVGPPVWLDDTHFNLSYHVRRTALASPGGEEELRALTGRVMSQQLDRTKPLWEMWAAEGLGGGRWAVISKTHHCMVDGVSATDLLSVLLDSEREPTRTPGPRWIPEPEPSARRMMTEPLAKRLASPVHVIASAADLARGPREAAELALQTVQGTAAMRSLLRLTPRSSLNGSIGPHRRWDWAHAALSDIKTVRAALGGTINDVVLTVVARGFRDLLISRGEDPARAIVRSLVPVSVRRPGERGTYNNRVSAMFAQLPVGIEEPLERLESVRSQMDGLKRSHEAVAGEVLTSLSGFAPALLLALGMRLAFRMPQRSLNTVTTNVPGPQRPLYLAGRRMLEAIPYVPLAGHVRIGVAIFSYDGSLKFGVTGDYDTAPDIRILCEGVERGMEELLAAAHEAADARAARKSRRAAKSGRQRSSPERETLP